MSLEETLRTQPGERIVLEVRDDPSPQYKGEKIPVLVSGRWPGGLVIPGDRADYGYIAACTVDGWNILIRNPGGSGSITAVADFEHPDKGIEEVRWDVVESDHPEYVKGRSLGVLGEMPELIDSGYSLLLLQPMKK